VLSHKRYTQVWTDRKNTSKSLKGSKDTTKQAACISGTTKNSSN